MIEIPRRGLDVFGAIGVAGVLAFVTLAGINELGLPVAIIGGALTAVVVLHTVWRVLLWAPALRASAEGASFSCGAIIPWREIDAIYDDSGKPGPYATLEIGKPRKAIYLTFHHRRTAYRLPIAMWLGALDRRGVRIELDGYSNASRLVADLEALRSTVPDGRAPERRETDATALPAARLRR